MMSLPSQTRMNCMPLPMGKTTDKGRRVAETGDGGRERVTTRQGSSMSQRQTASLGSGVMETARLQAAT